MRYQFVDCTYDLTDPERGRQLYLASHIPGASFLSLDRDLSDLSASNAGRHPLPTAEAFARAVSTAGIGYFTTMFTQNFDPTKLLGLISVLAAMAIVLNEIVRRAEVHFGRWRTD